MVFGFSWVVGCQTGPGELSCFASEEYSSTEAERLQSRDIKYAMILQLPVLKTYTAKKHPKVCLTFRARGSKYTDSRMQEAPNKQHALGALKQNRMNSWR
jgi:hypothetical protein